MADGVEFSDDDPGTIDVGALSASRFLLQRERQLPFRDASGRINVPLLERAHSAISAGEYACDPPTVDRVVAWLRHARAWQDARVGAKRPRPVFDADADEALTLDELFARDLNDVVARQLVGLGPPTPAKRGRRAAELPTTQRRESRTARPLLHAASNPRARPRYALRPCAARLDASAARLRRTASGNFGEAGGRSAESGEGSGEASSARSLSFTSGRSQSDVYEVERLLDERPPTADAPAAFIVRWAGYSPTHDTWEPEEHVAPRLVALFREARHLAASHGGADYGVRRTRQLWCALCRRHFHVDNFSARARRGSPAERKCLIHSAMMR